MLEERVGARAGVIRDADDAGAVGRRRSRRDRPDERVRDRRRVEPGGKGGDVPTVEAPGRGTAPSVNFEEGAPPKPPAPNHEVERSIEASRTERALIMLVRSSAEAALRSKCSLLMNLSST